MCKLIFAMLLEWCAWGLGFWLLCHLVLSLDYDTMGLLVCFATVSLVCYLIGRET